MKSKRWFEDLKYGNIECGPGHYTAPDTEMLEMTEEAAPEFLCPKCNNNYRGEYCLAYKRCFSNKFHRKRCSKFKECPEIDQVSRLGQR